MKIYRNLKEDILKINNPTKYIVTVGVALFLLLITWIFVFSGNVAKAENSLREMNKLNLTASTLTTTVCPTKLVITADDIARIRNGKFYIIDLTRRGVIYEFDSRSKRIDFNKVKVRMKEGDVLIETLLKKLLPKEAADKWKTKRLRIGATIGFTKPPRNAPIDLLEYQCDGLLCSCSGDTDCNDMFSSSECGDLSVCIDDIEGYPQCFCLRI